MKSYWVWALVIYAVMSLVSMATMSLAVAVLAVALVVLCRGPRRLCTEIVQSFSEPEVRAYALSSALLSASCVFSLVLAKFRPLSYNGIHSEVHFLKDIGKLWYLFWPLALNIGIRKLSFSERNRVLFAWIAAFAALSMLGILQHYTGWPRPQAIPGVPGRFHSTLFLGHHLSVASVFIFPFFASLDFVFQRKCMKKWGLPLIGVGFSALVFSYSRTLWVALPLGLLIWVYFSLKKSWFWLSSTAAVIVLLLASQSGVVRTRIHDNYGFDTRRDLWEANWAFFKARPFSGSGWRHNEETSGYYLMEKYHSNDVFSGHAHNNFLDMLGSTGLPGATAWLVWCAVVSVILWRLRKVGIGFSQGLFCAWVVFQLNGLTQVNFWEAKVLHQLTWNLGWMLAWAAERKKALI